MTLQRLDVALVARGLARSRSAAAAAVLEGRVQVAGARASRPARRVEDDAEIRLDAGEGWVGRGAGKLAAALDAFGVTVAGRQALDLGASTGGFTQVLLQRGAARVVAVDVGHDQLVPELRADPRVLVVEGVNARDLDGARYDALTGGAPRPGVVVADLSFIPLRLVLPPVADAAAADADLVLLVKPQFEVGRTRVHDGVVRSAAHRAEAVAGVLDAAWSLGLGTCGVIASSVVGARGNREVLVHLHRSRGSDPAQWTRSIEQVVHRPDGEAE